MVEALEEHRGIKGLLGREAEHVALDDGDPSGAVAAVRDEAAELLVELDGGDVQPGRHQVAGEIAPARSELDDAPRLALRGDRMGQAVEQVAARHQIAADQRQRAGLVRERPLQGGRQVEGRRLVPGVVAGATRDAAVEVPGPLPVGGGERVVGRLRRQGQHDPVEQGPRLVGGGGHERRGLRQHGVQLVERDRAGPGRPSTERTGRRSRGGRASTARAPRRTTARVDSLTSWRWWRSWSWSAGRGHARGGRGRVEEAGARAGDALQVSLAEGHLVRLGQVRVEQLL